MWQHMSAKMTKTYYLLLEYQEYYILLGALGSVVVKALRY